MLKQAIQVSQNDFFPFQAGLEIAQLPRNLCYFVVPPVFSVKEGLIVLVGVKSVSDLMSLVRKTRRQALIYAGP